MNHQWFRSESEHLRSACILVKASESLAGPWRDQPMGHGRGQGRNHLLLLGGKLCFFGGGHLSVNVRKSKKS